MTTYGPIFATRNHIDDVDELDGDISPSNSDKVADNVMRKIFDRNKERLCTTGSFKYPPTQGPFTITWTPGETKTVQVICIQETNLSAIDIKYNGGTDFSPAISVSSNTSRNLMFVVSSQDITSMTFQFLDVQVSGDAFEVGQIFVGDILYTIPDSMAGNMNLPDPQQKNSLIPLSDGTFNSVYVRSILNWNLAMRNVSAAERTSIKDEIYNYHRRSPFFFIPRPATPSDTWDGQAEHMLWANAPDFERFTEDHAVSGYDCNIRLLQAGGI